MSVDRNVARRPQRPTEAQEASRDEEETKEQHDDEVEAASSELQSGIDCECDPVCWGHMHPTIVVRD